MYTDHIVCTLHQNCDPRSLDCIAGVQCKAANSVLPSPFMGVEVARVWGVDLGDSELGPFVQEVQGACCGAGADLDEMQLDCPIAFHPSHCSNRSCPC